MSGFLLEAAINGDAEDSVRRGLVGQPAVPDANGVSKPTGAALIDGGMYNVGVRPIDEDVLRGGLDPWGWPLSLVC